MRLLTLGLILEMAGALKTIVVTGANKGIGRAVCEKLVKDYADTEVYLGSRDEAKGKKTCDEILAATPSAEGRLHLLPLDVSDASSIQRAAASIDKPIHGLLNNAGIGFGNTFADTLATNFFGTKMMCEAFLPLLTKGGRIVNIASASGPMFVSRCGNPDHRQAFARPDTVDIDTIVGIAESYSKLTDYDGEAYGLSKACVNAYTYLLAQAHPEVVVNSVTPGFIATDLTRGMGASNPPAMGARIPCSLLLDDDVPSRPTGRFYGSDGLRSPYDRYRDPGSPPYDGPP